MLEMVIGVYLGLVLILGLVSLVFLKEKFKKMSVWKMLLFVILQPILVLRELMKNRR